MSKTKSDYDYKELGLKVGIEIHQQLKTKGKLFCRCPNQLRNDDPHFTFQRNFRPVLGEEGKFDHAMLLEFKKKTIVEYEGYHDTNCTYELDEIPPFKTDGECLDIALEIGLLSNLNIIDELHICRKNYVDGSVPGGFQRTMIVGTDGKIPLTDTKDLGIEILCLEEDACKRISQEGNKVVFRLDRLGIPLVEIATAPELHTPEEAKLGSKRVGMLLRGTGKVKRQLGATRQDINVSIKGGSRIEIKGVQKLDWIPPLVKNEVRRQLALIDIKNKMLKLGLTPKILSQKSQDVTKLLKNTKCKFVNKGIKNKLNVWGLRVPKMDGLWGIEVQEGRRFGTEVANKVKVITGLKGLIHSDENLNKYNFSEEEISSIIKALKCEDGDLFVLILGKVERLKDAMEIVVKRIIKALDGVPGETRKALENGNHEFLRDLHGGARLYPDTDSREIILSKERIERIKKDLPKYAWDQINDYVIKYKKYNIKPEMFEELIFSAQIDLFDEIIESFSGKVTLVTKVMLETTKTIRREGKDISNITDKHFLDLFKLVDAGKIAKEAIEPILTYICDNPDEEIKNAAKKLNIKSMTKDDLQKIIVNLMPKFEKLIEQRGMGAMGSVMGAVMKEARGKIDGQIVSKAVKESVMKAASTSKSAGKSPSKNGKKKNKPKPKKSSEKKGGK